MSKIMLWPNLKRVHKSLRKVLCGVGKLADAFNISVSKINIAHIFLPTQDLKLRVNFTNILCAAFCARSQLLCTYILCLYLFDAKKSAQKLFFKFW